QIFRDLATGTCECMDGHRIAVFKKQRQRGAELSPRDFSFVELHHVRMRASPPSQLLQQCLCAAFKGGSALTRKALTVLKIPYKSSKFFRSAALEHRWLYFVANLEGIQESLLSRDAATASCTSHQGSL